MRATGWAQAKMLNDLGMVRYATDDYQDATAALEEVLCLYHDPEDQLGQANAGTNLGKVRLEIRRLSGHRRSA